MSKRVRTLILSAVALLAITGLLVALLLLPENTQNAGSGISSTPYEDLSVKLIDKSVDADGKKVEHPIERIDITMPDETFAVQKDADGEMQVAAYADFMPNTTKLNSLVTYLKTIKADRLVKADVQDMSVYGFGGETAVTVKVTYYDGTEYTFELGTDSPGEAGRYMREQGGDDVYLMASYFASTVTTPSLSYISHTLITAPTANSNDMSGTALLRNMELGGTLRPQKVLFRRVNEEDAEILQQSQYVLTTPELRPMEGEIVKAITQSTSLTAASVVCPHPTAQQLKEYGLDKPFSVAVFDLAVLSTQTTTQPDGSQLKEEYYYNVQSHTVRLGNKTAEGHYYALVDDIDMVVTLMPTAVAWAEQTYDTLIEPLLFLQKIADMKNIILTVNGTRYDFALTHYPDESDRNKSMSVAYNGQIYSTPDMRKLYQVLMSIRRIGPAQQQPTGEPVLTVEMTPIEGSQGQPVKAELYKLGGAVYLCKQANGDIYQVAESTVSHAIEQLNNYLSGKPVIM